MRAQKFAITLATSHEPFLLRNVQIRQAAVHPSSGDACGLDEKDWLERAQRFSKVYDVRSPALATPAASLSGGNQQKLIFAREMLSRPLKLLIAHQPTRGVDLAAVRLIHEKIIQARDEGVAVLVISSELDELFALSDRLMVMASGRMTGEFSRIGGQEFDRGAVGDAMIVGSRRAGEKR